MAKARVVMLGKVFIPRRFYLLHSYVYGPITTITVPTDDFYIKINKTNERIDK